MHHFKGIPITNEEFCTLSPQNVFFRECDRQEVDTAAHRNRHILFRRSVTLKRFATATAYLSADDHYLLYVNGIFVAEGPAPAYHTRQNYNTVDLTPYLHSGDNLIAVHTYYQGLINRVWQSGDNRHFFLFDLEVDGKTVLVSDESFRTAPHTAYRAIGITGYDTDFLEEYDANAPEVGFESPDYNDSAWEYAKAATAFDQILFPQATEMLSYDRIAPLTAVRDGQRLQVDFGATYAGRLWVKVSGKGHSLVTVRLGEELNADQSVRYKLRANCCYEEAFRLKTGETVYAPYLYRAFRYAELLLPEDAEVDEILLLAQHYPFTAKTPIKPAYRDEPALVGLYQLCLHTLKYGVQDAPLDCLEREKGFYLGDGCYTSLAHMLVTGKDAMVRKLIDDAFASAFITDTLMCCLNASFMQEIAEFPLILCRLVLWHYRYTGDLDYLKTNYPKVTALLDAYRRDYERNHLLQNLDKWCVVEWPPNFRHGYDVDLTSGKVCREAHTVMNAYYIHAIRAANAMAAILSQPVYRDESPLIAAFTDAFYLPERLAFRDSTESSHTSFLSGLFAYAFSLCQDADAEREILGRIREEKVSSVSLFGAFVMLEGLVRHHEGALVREMLLDRGAWLRMLREDATTTFESWGKDTKWNTSLFHTTFSYAAVFLADVDLETLFP
ncbi:MAG: family 78 glycoside hydrolase catalytic domain [Clostridia bacterium]|nr:family 78 glycoside hydrolase catalytic domain [Clostridia bacterium]